jgi:excisionase family DNA binding protein
MITAAEAAALKGVNDSAIRHAIARGTLPAVKKGGAWLLRRADVLSWQPREWGPGRPKAKFVIEKDWPD